MTTPSGSIVAPGQQPYRGRWKYRPDNVTMYARGRPDWRSGENPPPDGTIRAQVGRVYGRSIYIPPVVVSREDLVLGVDRPTRAVAGCVDRGLLVEQSANISYAGSSDPLAPLVVLNKWFTGKVTVSSGYIDFKNCQFNGDPLVGGSLLQCTSVNVKRVRLYDCDLWAQNPQWNSASLAGHHVEMYRCYIRGCIDGIAHIGVGANGTSTGDYTGIDQGMVMEQCLIERMSYQSPDPGAAGKLPDNASHLDVGCQTRGGNNFRFRGNAIYAYIDPTINEGGLASVDMLSGTHLTGKREPDTGLYALSAFMFSPFLGSLSNWVADSNWMDGASYLFVVAQHLSGISITNNNFGRDHRAQPGLILALQTAVIPVTNNKYWYELGPAGEKWPYSGVAIAEAGETTPSSAKIAEWAAAGISADRATWPNANTRSRG